MAQQPNLQGSAEPCSVCGKAWQSYSQRQLRLKAHERKCAECMNTAREVAEEEAMTKSENAGFNVPKLKTSDDPCGGCGCTGVLFSTREAKKRPGFKRCIDCMEEIKRQRIELFGAFPGQEAPPERSGTNIVINENTLTDEDLAHRMHTEWTREAKFVTEQLSMESGTAGIFQDLPKPQLAEEPCSECFQYGVPFSKRQMLLDPSIRRCLPCMNNGQVPGGKVVADAAEVFAPKPPQREIFAPKREIFAPKPPQRQPSAPVIPPPNKRPKFEPNPKAKVVPAKAKVVPARRVQVSASLVEATVDGWMDKDQLAELGIS